MSEPREEEPEPAILHLLELDEHLDLPFNELRRIQFDIEATRPATLVIVPESALEELQVLAVPFEEIDGTAKALSVVGRRLSMRT